MSDIKLKDKSAEEKYQSLFKPIMKVLQEAGGQLERSEVVERICDMDDQIADFAQEVKQSKKTGKTYRDFDFRFNFALKGLLFNNLLMFSRNTPITLTNKGLYLNLDNLDIDSIIENASKGWEEASLKRKEKRKKQESNIIEQESDVQPSEELKDQFKNTLLSAISKMSPKKFEAFSRALLNKMGVEFSSDKGVQISNDGGIDGYGYHIDVNDFRTTRVVIQCKRYNVGPVSEPDINQFLGAMNKYQADYGVFITNGRFTNAARVAAKEGSPITLIDGNELVRLVIRYELYITPVTTYVLDDFYKEEELFIF